MEGAEPLVPSLLQRLDATCAAVAQAGLAVQLAAVLWRLLGSLLALEGMVVVLFKPLWLTRLHAWLAGAVVRISGALHHVGAGGRVIDAGVCITQPCLYALHSPLSALDSKLLHHNQV